MITIDKLLELTNNLDTIYDFITELFVLVTDNNEQANISSYHRWLSEKKTDLLSQIDILVNFVYKTDQKPIFIQKWLQCCRDNQNEVVPIIIETLVVFDACFAEPKKNHNKSLISHGPLNKGKSNLKALFYLMPRNKIQDRFENYYKLFSGRKLATSHPSGLKHKFSNYTVIPLDSLSGYKPYIKSYQPSNGRELFHNGVINIAIFPFSNRKWFSCSTTKSGREFNIINDPGNMSFINTAYIEAICKADNKGADIAVFPELAMNDQTLNCIQSFLREVTTKLSNLKLIFLGSNWFGKANIAHVLSSSGKLLLSQCKQEPYSHFDKTIQDYIRENIAADNKDLLFLDIEGLGRISYSICRDFTDVTKNEIRYAELYSGITIISSYSSNLSVFETCASSSVTSYDAIIAMCNCCAPVLDGKIGTCENVGFVAIPQFDNGTLNCKLNYYSSPQDSCTKKGNVCKFCNCMNFFSLDYSQKCKKNPSLTKRIY